MAWLKKEKCCKGLAEVAVELGGGGDRPVPQVVILKAKKLYIILLGWSYPNQKAIRLLPPPRPDNQGGVSLNDGYRGVGGGGGGGGKGWPWPSWGGGGAGNNNFFLFSCGKKMLG